MKLAPIALTLALLPHILSANQTPMAVSMRLVEGRALSSQESALYPERVELPRALFGRYRGFRKDTLMLRVSCGVNESRPVEIDGKPASEYAPLYRLELYKMLEDGDGEDDEAWEFVAWFRFSEPIPHNACKAFRQAATLASANRPVMVQLQIDSAGGQRNTVKSWKLQEP
jgi:hypothetical protein